MTILGRENNFKKYNSFVTSDFGVPYDYDSVLHYSAFAFSKNGKKTIVPQVILYIRRRNMFIQLRINCEIKLTGYFRIDRAKDRYER